MKKIILALFAALFVCTAALYAQNPTNTITVQGIGTVMAPPDMAQISIHFTHTAPTTHEAKDVVSKTMHKVLDILKEAKVEDKFIKTSSYSFDVEYDYSKSKRVKVGQRAEQTIVVKINNLVDNPDRFSAVIDKISEIDKVEIQNIQFDIENKAELYRQSRESAYNKAFEKASQYAKLAGRKISKAVTISENMSYDVAQTSMRNMAYNKIMDYAMPEEASYSDGAVLPSGEQGVTSVVNVVFEME